MRFGVPCLRQEDSHIFDRVIPVSLTEEFLFARGAFPMLSPETGFGVSPSFVGRAYRVYGETCSE